ncbi:MAG: 4Fe-4S binding protein [Deltaproteobacteria bacterium]|nr:4Fe-4S binding protein [Candidatus Anaeroferrophillus wilburensis]MBN2888523.1 4Fe-4S binding protein [Deltaproteobacteria bacterium]
MEKQLETTLATPVKTATATTKALPKITVFTDWCKQCGICVAFCPQQVLAMDEHRRVFAKYPDKCIACHMCELRCPDFAITVKEPEQTASGKTKEETV